MAASAEKPQLFNRVVFCGPSGARCGVCVTTALWVQGLDRAQTSGVIGQLEWLTNSVPQDIPIDPCVSSSVRRVRAYRRPGAWLSEDDDVDDPLAVATVTGLSRNDLFVLEQSSAVIDPSLANRLCAMAKARGAVVAVRLHSQLLQGLNPAHVDLFVAPFALVDANKLRDSEVRGAESERWVEIGHPCPVRLSTPAAPHNPRLVYGLGARGKSAHRLVRSACERLGLVYDTLDIDPRPWASIAEYVERLSRAAVIVIYYLPLNGIGRSSALGCAVATGHPVIASDSVMLEDARAWNGGAIECDLDEVLVQAIERHGVATAAQDAYAARHGPESSAMALLQAARATRRALNVH